MAETVLVIASHPDDEVLGCGGTIAKLAAGGAAVHIVLMSDGETSRLTAKADRAGTALVEMRNDAAREACRILGCASVEALGLPDNRMDGLDMLDVVKLIEEKVAQHKPSTILTHHAGDVNVDHRVVHQAVLAACRPQPGHSVETLLFFEVPSSTEWSPPGSAPAFTPNWFVDISGQLSAKLAALRAYDSELRPFPHPRSIEAVEALAKWRGATAGFAAAEAFILGRRLISGNGTR